MKVNAAGVVPINRTVDTEARPLPHDLEVERTILGAIILNNSALDTAVERISSEDFFLSQHRLIFVRMIGLKEQGKPIDALMLKDDLARRGELESAGGIAYLSKLTDGQPSITNVEFYCNIVKEKSALRSLAFSAQAIMERALAAEEDPQDIITQSVEAFSNIGTTIRSSAGIELQPYGQISKEHLHFMWPEHLPLGKLVHLAGDSGEGKSPLSLDLIARTTSGADWPDGSKNTLGPRSVILLAGEDDCADTIRPRLELAGADLSRVFNVRCTAGKGQNRHEILLALDRDIHQLAAQARKIPDLAFAVADPITNYLGKVQMRVEEVVRSQILMPLAAVAAELNICALTIGHLNRRERGTSPLQRIMGAAAFHGVARYIYFVGPDPDDDDKFSHILVQQRGGNAPSLRYRTVTKPMTWDGETSDVVQIEWRGASGATSQDAVDPQQGAEKSATDKAAQDLINILKSGRVPAVEAKQLLKDAGHDVEKLNWTRVHRKARVGTDRFDSERYYSWFIKDQK